jgi:hypothetical protein
MKIIILAQEKENHTAPIQWALERAGYQVACWAGLSWTEEQQASLLLGQHPNMVLGRHAVEPGDVVWVRQPGDPGHNPKVAEADRKFAAAEYHRFYDSIAYMLETLPVWCINRFSASRMVKNKAVQLRLARTCGLKIPKTLMSNSPGAVKNFIDHNPGRTICKAFAPHLWQSEDGGVAVNGTFELSREQLPADEVFTLAPGIYQHMVVKQFDVRTVLMGSNVYSYGVHTANNALDWRRDAGIGNIEVEIIATPGDIESGILAFAKKAGICFGSMDFAVDMNGQWWFLEINEQGQFLWLDAFNRESKLQEKFCAFITALEGSTQPLEEREGLFPSFIEYEELRRQLQPKHEPLDIAAAAPGSPHMSLEP